MPSTQSVRRLLGLLVLLCVCTQSAAGTVATPHATTADAGCFPRVDHIESGEAVGDVVELEMLVCFRGIVTVSGPGYEANISVDKGNWSGGATVRLDTRLNDSDAIRVRTSHERSAKINATGNGSFQPGRYTVTLSYGNGDRADTIDFTLGQPQARNLTVFKAPEGAASDLDTVAAVREVRARSPTDSARRVDDPNTSDHLKLATNETLVVAVRADGLEGAVENGTGTPLSRFRTAIDDAGGSFAVRQTDYTVTPSRQALTPDLLNSSATHLVPDPDNDTYYLVVDTPELRAEWEGHGSVIVGNHRGAGYAVRFSMQNVTDTVPADLVAADFRVVEAAVGPPEGVAVEPHTVRPRENATLRFRTTLAAGTPVTVTVTGHPDGSVNRTARVQRVGNGTSITLALNLSGVPNGTSLNATVERDGEALDGEVNAVVRPAPDPTETPTETSSPTPETATASPAPSTSTPAAKSPTRRLVPGFGVLHGAVALLLAMLARRRRRD